jgi:arginyl-tRNA synthetase
MHTLREIKHEIQKQLATGIHVRFGKNIAPSDIMFEKPPKDEWGDFAFPLFQLAKENKENPAQLANELSSWLTQHPHQAIERTEVKGPFLNIHVNRTMFAHAVVNEIQREGKNFGASNEGHAKRIMIEFSSPNTNKPLHLGHLRNNALGYALSLILEKQGYEVVRTSLVNDRGIHIMQSMVAYQKWGKGSRPKREKSDAFVGRYYVLYNKELKKQLQKLLEKDSKYVSLEGVEKKNYEREAARNTAIAKEAQEMLRQWEAGNKKVLALWKKMNKWALAGHNATYKALGIQFDDTILESEIYKEGKEIVTRGLEKGVFEKLPDGRVIARLEDVKLPDRTLLRADGTTLYITQDLHLARIKFEKWHVDISVYVVASEQDIHFQQLFAILKKLGYKFANPEQLLHRSYGLVGLPEGRMKSREGTVVDTDDVIQEVEALVAEKIRSSDTSSKKNVKKVSHQIGIGAIKFLMLSQGAPTEITYDPKKAIALEGYTGPFVQYAYARGKSVLKKSKMRVNKKFHAAELQDDAAFRVIKALAQYPEKAQEAAHRYDPSLLARYLFELAQSFNAFYHAEQILKADAKAKEARLALVAATCEVLKDGLSLLGMEAPESM